MREASISEQLQCRSIVVVESSIPAHLTLAEWRRRRPVSQSRCPVGIAAIRRTLQRVRLRSSLGARPSRGINVAFSLVRSWVR